MKTKRNFHTLDAISRKFRINLDVSEASFTEQIGNMNQLVTWVKPKEQRYNANGYSCGITGWDQIYICIGRRKGQYFSQQVHDVKPSLRTALRREINKMKSEIEEEYYAYQDAMEEKRKKEEENYPY